MNICYTGIGAKKSGQHTKKQFLSAMKSSKRDCALFIKSLTCKACQKSKNLTAIFTKKSNTKKNSIDKYLKDIQRLTEKCRKCKNKTRKQCTLENFLEYSGAFHGNCNK